MKYSILLISILIVLMTNESCIYDPPPEKIFVQNNSADTIYVYCTCSDSIELNRRIYSYLISDSDSIHGYKIPPFSKGGVQGASNLAMAINRCKDSTIKMFFIHDTIIRKVDWEQIYSHQLYMRKVVLTAEELEQSNWTYVFD